MYIQSLWDAPTRGCVESWFPNQAAHIRAMFKLVPRLLCLLHNISEHISEKRCSLSLQYMLACLQRRRDGVSASPWTSRKVYGVGKILKAIPCPLNVRWRRVNTQHDRNPQSSPIGDLPYPIFIDNSAHFRPNLRRYTLFSRTFAYSLKNAHEPTHFKHARCFSFTQVNRTKTIWRGWPCFRRDFHANIWSGFELSQRSTMRREAHPETMHTILQPRVLLHALLLVLAYYGPEYIIKLLISLKTFLILLKPPE